MSRKGVQLFLCGDVMCGRGIDQILPHPCNPRLHEPYVRDARIYVALAEQRSGVLAKPVEEREVWGWALVELMRRRPDFRLVNLETALTESESYDVRKGIHYRMHPANVSFLTAAGIDCCALANNHVLDWGLAGLEETLATLEAAGIGHAGAGADRDRAAAPALKTVAGGCRLLVFSMCTGDSGVPPEWAATERGGGFHLLSDLSEATAEKLATEVRRHKRHGDIAIASIHWGGNWGYEINDEQRRFAHALIDRARIDVVHGHSSHHVKGLEVYRDRLVLYGCGDFINDYEGIGGYEQYRGDLGLMYFPFLAPEDGHLQALEMVPTRLRRLSVQRASAEDARWLASVLDRESSHLGTHVGLDDAGRLILKRRRG